MTLSYEMRQSLKRLVENNRDLANLVSPELQAPKRSTQSVMQEQQEAVRALTVAILNRDVSDQQIRDHRQAIKDLALKEQSARLPQLVRLDNLTYLAPRARLAIIETARDLCMEAGAAFPSEWSDFLATTGLLKTDNLEGLLNV